MEPQKVNSLIKCPRCNTLFNLAHQSEKLHTRRQCVKAGCGAVLDIHFKPDKPALVDHIDVIDPEALAAENAAAKAKQAQNNSADNTIYNVAGGGSAGHSSSAGSKPQVKEPDYNGNMALVGKGLFGLTKHEYPLKKGDNFVGRGTSDDIVIRKDDTASRRSVRLEVYYNTYTGYACRMEVLKATNPVLRNGLPVATNEIIDLVNNDTLTLGHTTFTFIKK